MGEEKEVLLSEHLKAMAAQARMAAEGAVHPYHELAELAHQLGLAAQMAALNETMMASVQEAVDEAILRAAAPTGRAN